MKRKKPSIKEIVARLAPRFEKHEVEEIGDRIWKRLEAEMDKYDLSLRSLYGDGWSAPALNDNEHLVLTLIAQSQGEERHELRLMDQAKEMKGMGTFTFARTLRRLTDRGLVTQITRTNFKRLITEDGERALARARAEGRSLACAGDELEGGTEIIR